MIVPFEAHCSWHLCQIQAQHLEQHFCAETRFKLRLQIGSPSQGFLITSLISPISWGCLPCKPHKVRISTLIKPSFSDNSRVLKISDCYLRAVECHSCLSPPTVTLNAVIKWGRVLLSLSSHSSPWSGSSSVCSKTINLTNKWVREAEGHYICLVIDPFWLGFWGSAETSKWKVENFTTSPAISPTAYKNTRGWERRWGKKGLGTFFKK